MSQTDLIAFCASLFFTSFAAWPILKALIALKSRQNVYSLAPQTHQKKQGTPTMGGIIVLFGVLVGVLIAKPDWQLCLWVVGFGLIGFTDDYVVPRLIKGKRGLGWKQKIAAQVVLAVLAVPVFHLPWTGSTVATMAFLVLAYSNAYNFADGLDGLSGSLGLLLSFGFLILSRSVTPDVVPTQALYALIGGFIPFLFLNAPPAKVFMGDVGSLPIGALFGACSTLIVTSHFSFTQQFPRENGAHYLLASGSGSIMILPVLILSLVMVAELLPVPLQVGYFKLTKKRLFPMTPIHHSFEVKGWPESRVVWCFALTQLTLTLLACMTVQAFRQAIIAQDNQIEVQTGR